MARPLSAKSCVTAALVVAVIDTAYLSWRFVALEQGWVEAGTGLCSWTDTIDCDLVLSTPDARAFWVPNAILGWAFFSAALIWWTIGPRIAPTATKLIARVAAAWLALASILTLWFWWLLLHLPFLCPFCPWNHVWTYVAFGSAWAVARAEGPDASAADRGRLTKLFVGCAAWFLSWQIGWAMF